MNVDIFVYGWMMKTIKWIVNFILISMIPLNIFALGLTLQSSSFQANASIPPQFTCQGANISPSLSWTHAPQNTQSFALIMLDPDAPSGNWVHWIVYNLPSNTLTLEQNARLPLEAVSGLNSWNKTGYSGPCPPTGTHRYFFRLYALDTVLQLSNTAQYNDVINAMQQHIIEEASLMGIYGAQK